MLLLHLFNLTINNFFYTINQNDMKSRIIFSAMLIAFASITMFSCKKDKKELSKRANS